MSALLSPTSRPADEAALGIARPPCLVAQAQPRHHATETSHAFVLPALLQMEGRTLADRSAAWTEHVRAIEAELAAIQAEIDERCFDLYGIDEEDRRAITEGFGGSSPDAETAEDGADADAEDEAEAEAAADTATLAAELVSWAVGVAFGRFDVRLATGARELPGRARAVRSVAGLLARDAHRRRRPAARPSARRLSALVPRGRDPRRRPGPPARPHGRRPRGVRHGLRRLGRRGLAGGGSPPRPQGPRPAHLARPGVLRPPPRAPLQEPPQGADPLAARTRVGELQHLALRPPADPRQPVRPRRTSSRPSSRSRSAARRASSRRRAPTRPRSSGPSIAAQDAFVAELRVFADEVRRVAPLWNPDLDDGIVLVEAPLWRLVPHKPWQKELKSRWDDLAAGKYDWAHLAMHLWPERVVPKCATDRSLAIAHGLEDVFWAEGADGKWTRRARPTRSVEELVAERTSPAVKAALADLLAAPGTGSRRPGPGEEGGVKTMHPLHEYIARQVAEWVKSRVVVVWYDPRREFEPFVAELLDGAPDPGWAGWCLAGRREGGARVVRRLHVRDPRRRRATGCR